ncbi:kinase A anchor protein [Xylariaceae sp. FL1651]|nr:kinase A anchor protein [Xylariaceae sp. FL1651]
MPPRPSPTHFLCIPLVTGTSRQQLSASLASFSADVINPNSFGVPEQAIRPVGTLHLTLGVMSFPKNEGLEKAVALLKTLVPRQILASITSSSPRLLLNSDQRAMEAKESPGPPLPLLSVTLKGLHSMQPAAKASVLYAPPIDPEGILAKFCEALRTYFQEAGLMAEENRPLLLHATILNTIYVKGRNSSPSARGKKHEKLTIDARQILERYDDYLWMRDVPIEKIAICRMGAKIQEDGDAAYEVESEIDIT